MKITLHGYKCKQICIYLYASLNINNKDLSNLSRINIIIIGGTISNFFSRSTFAKKSDSISGGDILLRRINISLNNNSAVNHAQERIFTESSLKLISDNAGSVLDVNSLVSILRAKSLKRNQSRCTGGFEYSGSPAWYSMRFPEDVLACADGDRLNVSTRLFR